MKKLTLTTLMFSFALAQVGFAATNSDHSNGMNTSAATSSTQENGSGHCEHMKKLLSALNLDPAQKTKIDAIKDQLKQDQKANWDQMRSIRTQMIALITSDTLDEPKLDTLINQKKELLGQMIKAKITAKQQIYSLLNDQQKAKFKQLLEQWVEKKNKGC